MTYGKIARELRETKKIQEPSWNPSVESQATDRAYRLGQTCTTHIIRYFVEGSIEVNMMEVRLIEYYPDLRVFKQLIVKRFYTHTRRYKKGSKSWHSKHFSIYIYSGADLASIKSIQQFSI